MKTPELKKISKVAPDSQKIGEFLEWLSGQDIVLAKWAESDCICGGEPEMLITISTSREQFLANYFGIDLVKAEKERQALLDDIRAKNEESAHINKS